MSERKVVIPRFEILRRGEVIRTVPLNRSRLIIGSEDGASLRLKHPAIAPRHLEVTVVRGKYLEAANLAGEGRVLLGGQPMNKARLREGDELDLGPVSLRLSYSRPDAEPLDEAPTDRPAAPGSDAFDDEEPTDPGGTGSAPPPPDESLSDVELDDIVLDPTPVVVIEPPGGRPQRVPLRVGSFVVGAGRCAFRLSYPGVAPAHAEIMVMPDGVAYVKHLAGSGLLTLRNGAPVQFSRWVAGDRLQIGPVTMQLESVPRAELLAPPPTPASTAAPTPAPRKAKAPPSSPLPSLGPTTDDRIPKAGPPPASAPPPGPTPAAKPTPPLVRARHSAPAKVSKPKAIPPGAAKVRANRRPAPPPVQVQLHVSSQDTFASLLVDDEPLGRVRPWWQSAALPLLILVLLAVIGWQGYRLMHMNDVQASDGAPRTARGASGVDAANVERARPGDGPIRVGEFERSGRRGGSRGSGSGGGGGGGNIDWEDQRGGVYFEGARSAGGEAGRIPLHAAEEITERKAEAGAPAEVSQGVEQGFVEMKHVEAAIYEGRRKLRYCYTSARQDDDGLEGTMWLTLTLTSGGRVRGAVQESRSTLKSEGMRNCLERQLYGLDMPKPTGGSVTFSYPFEFHPSD